MIPRDVKSPTVAIPFHKMLKVVIVADGGNQPGGDAGTCCRHGLVKRLAARAAFEVVGIGGLAGAREARRTPTLFLAVAADDQQADGHALRIARARRQWSPS